MSSLELKHLYVHTLCAFLQKFCQIKFFYVLKNYTLNRFHENILQWRQKSALLFYFVKTCVFISSGFLRNYLVVQKYDDRNVLHPFMYWALPNYLSVPDISVQWSITTYSISDILVGATFDFLYNLMKQINEAFGISK